MKRNTLFALFLAISLLFAACAPAATEAPVVQTARAEAAAIESTQMAAAKAAEDNAKATAIMAAALGTPTATTTQVLRPVEATVTPIQLFATPTPNSPIWECYYSGARMTDGHVPDAERIGGAGYCDINALINSVSMQAFWEEVVNNDTELPVGLERTDVATGVFEANNDFVYVFAIRHGGPMLYFVADATESNSAFPFWWTSCVQYNVETQVMTFYKDDSGQPGGFDGACKGAWKEFSGKTADKFSGEVMTYIQAIEALATKGYKTPNQPYVLDIVWFEVWPK